MMGENSLGVQQDYEAYIVKKDQQTDLDDALAETLWCNCGVTHGEPKRETHRDTCPAYHRVRVKALFEAREAALKEVATNLHVGLGNAAIEKAVAAEREACKEILQATLDTIPTKAILGTNTSAYSEGMADALLDGLDKIRQRGGQDAADG